MTLIIFLLIISLLILVHEFGHFIVARLFKIQVDEFALGFPPPRLMSWVRDKTRFSLNLWPLGGYVKLLGEDESDERLHKNKKSFSAKPPTVRLLVVIAGVALNFVLAFVIFLLGFTTTGLAPTTLEAEGLPAGEVRYEFFVHEVVEGSPAAIAGITAGSLLKSGEGDFFTNEGALSEFTAAHQGEQVTLLVRDGGRKEIEVLLGQGSAPLGVKVSPSPIIKASFGRSVVLAARETWGTFAATFAGIYRLIAGLIVEREVREVVTGPVGIFSITGAAARLGLPYLLQLVSVLSVNLGIINILPFPALDGGRATFIILERLFKRKIVRAQIENMIHTIGFVLLILLIVAITFRDLSLIR